MNQLAKSRINLLGTRLAAIRTLVLDMPPAIAAQALSYTPECAEDHATMARSNMGQLRLPPARNAVTLRDDGLQPTSRHARVTSP